MKSLLNIFVTSDQHFNHFKISQLCGRKFRSLEEMHNVMIKLWNNTIRPQDIVIHLGDIVLTKGDSSNLKFIIKQLNGRKILVKGNHDRKSYSWYLNNGFDFICEKFNWYYNRKKILFLHDPNKITVEDTKKYNFIIHGHIHNKKNMIRKRKKCTLINVSVEKTNYFPLNLHTLLEKLNRFN